MRKLIVAAVAAASILVPATALAGDYLYEFEGRPNQAVQYVDTGYAQPAAVDSYAVQGAGHVEMPIYSGTFETPALPAYQGPAYQDANFCGTKPKRSNCYVPPKPKPTCYTKPKMPKCYKAPKPKPTCYTKPKMPKCYVAPKPKPSTGCAPTGCVYSYRNSHKRYDEWGRRVQ